MRKIVCSFLLVFLGAGAASGQSSILQIFAGGGVPQNVSALSASLGYVSAVAVSNGNVYITLNAYSAVMKMDTSGNLSLIAGNGKAGFAGDNGPAANAQLNNPWGIAVDASGNVYIADAGNNRIRKVSNGVITTVVGGGAGSLANPRGVALDAAGNLYIADTDNNVVRKWSNGALTTVAGTGAGGFSGYSGTATSVNLNGPRSIALDPSGNLYIADYGNGLIRKVANGALTTLLQVYQPTGIAADGSGNVYMTSFGNNVVGRITAGGAISVFAGNQIAGYAGDGGAATGAQLNAPAGVAVDPAGSGNVYIADFYNSVVRVVTAGKIYTVAGSNQGLVGDGGSPANALLLKPLGTATGPSGEVYIVDSSHNRVRKVLNGVISTFAGTGVPGFSGDTGQAASAQLNAPWGVAVDSSGNVYISDLGNQIIRKVTSAGVISTYAGVLNTPGFNNDSVTANTSYLSSPAGIAVDSSGNLYIADFGNHRIRKVTASTGMITTVAGNGTGGFSGDGGAATSAELFKPVDVKLDSSGNIYIADSGNNLIRKVSGANISTIAGNTANLAGGYTGDGGPATSARLNTPYAIALDSSGNVYIADSNNSVVRQVSSGVINTIAGNGVAGYSGDQAPPTSASLNNPAGLSFGPAGQLYISDSGNDLVRVINNSSTLFCTYSVSPTSVQATASGGSFSIAVQTPASCIWTVSDLPSWATVSVPSNTGPGSVNLVVAPNLGLARSANITVAGITVALTQGTCAYAISPASQVFPATGGSGTINVSTSSGCAWTATNTNPWITLSSAGGSGSGVLNFTVAASNVAQMGTFTVAGLPFTVYQQAASIPGLSLIGSMPHIAAEENWITTFTMVNQSAAPNQVRLNLFGNSGSTLQLPLNLPQQPNAGVLLAASTDNTVSPYASWIVSTAGQGIQPVQVGSAQVNATGALGGFAIFHRVSDAQEAVVPLETRKAPSYLLAFDNTNGLVTSAALENVSSQSANVPYILRDDTGAQIGGGTVPVAGNGHLAFVLTDPLSGFPQTANKRGTVEFDTPSGGQISVLGIRNASQGTVNTLTTIPALANVGTGGGSIAHLASGNGWQTTFVLVNTGSSAAQATVNFFADVTGAPLSLPVSFPQTGTTLSTVNSVNRTLAAGATLLIQSTGALADPLLTGSAQLSTTGNVSGFVIFHYNPNGQEAVVPLQSVNASAYTLAFDNTAGTATGVALNNASAQSLNVPVIIRDDGGNLLATDTLSLAPNGHLAFTLATDKYPMTANVRGTIEFDTPPGGQIGALGIRIPVAHTFTTLPPLTR